MQSVSAGGGNEDRMTAGKIEGNESTVSVKLSDRRDGRRYEIDMRYDGMGCGRLETLPPIQELNQPFHDHNSVNLSLTLVRGACFLCPHFTGGRSSGGQRTGTHTCKYSDVDISVFGLGVHGLNKEAD